MSNGEETRELLVSLSNDADRARQGAYCCARAGLLALSMATALLGLLSAGSSEAGDLGRPQRSFLFASPLANWFSDAPLPSMASPLTMTVEEVEMRDTAYRLRVHVFNLTAIAADPDAVASYANYLMREGYVFGLSRMASIDQEIAADQEALERFGFAAQKVLFADSQRRVALHQPGLQAPPFVRRDAENRIQENCAFIQGTFADMDLRLAAYREAIDRTILETPPVGNAVIDQAFDQLVARTVMLRRELLQPCFGGEVVVQRDRPMDIRPYK